MVKLSYEKETGLTQESGTGFNVSGNLFLNNSVSFSPKTFESNDTIGEENIVFADATNGKITLTLPSANSSFGKWICFKKIDATGNAVDISPQSGQQIDAQSKLTISSQNDSFTIVASGSNWYIL